MSEKPQNIRAEQGLLGLILLRNDLIFEIAEVAKTDFAEEHNGELFILFKDLISMGRAITAVTILHDAQDAVVWTESGLKASEYLSFLEGNAPLTDQVTKAKEFAVAIRDAALNARVLSTLDQLRDKIVNSPASIPGVKLRDEVDSAITALFSTSQDLGFHDIAEVGDRILARLKNKATTGRALGIAALQDLTGPALPARLMNVAGGSGSGKSALLSQIARFDAESGGTPLMFGMEMPAEETVARILASDTGIKGPQIEQNFISDQEFEALYNANEKLRGVHYKVADAAKFSVPFIRARVMRQQKLGGCSMVLIDHLHYLAKSDRRMGDNDAINENLEGLKGMAVELGVPVITASQLSSAALAELAKWPHRQPNFSDLLFFGAIDRNCDVVVLIHRLEYMLKRNEPDKEADVTRHGEWAVRLEQVRGKVDVILCKRRGGEGAGRRIMHFDSPRTLFADRAFRRDYGNGPQSGLPL